MNNDPAIKPKTLFEHPRTIDDVSTPALILDRSRLERNARRMADKMAALGVMPRPHVKTSKSLDVLQIMTNGQPQAITVSTLAEAEYFFERGVADILYAVGMAPVKLPQAAALLRAGCHLKIVVDTLEAARAVAQFGDDANVCFATLIEIDTDGHRAGVLPNDPTLIDIAFALKGPGAQLAGVMTHAGDSYSCRSRSAFEAIAEQERLLTIAAADRLRSAGFGCAIVSVGSTPTVHYARSMEGVTEARCGVYAFGDLVQAGLGTCGIEDVAVAVLASVISHKPSHDRVIVDAGFLALSRDRGTSDLPVDWGYGAVCDAGSGELLGDLFVSAANQEHGIITSRNGSIDFSRLPIGKRVKILPNHACATSAAHGRYLVTEGGSEIIDSWERLNGW